MNRRAALVTVLAGGDPWQSVAAPAGFTAIAPPFTIQQNGRSFRIDPAFSLQTYAEAQGITVAKTYYVDITNGLDTNSGLDKANALQTLATAVAKADVDRVVIAKGYYTRSQTGAGVTPGRNVELIGDLTWGVGDAVYLTADCRNQVGAFSAVDSHYAASTARNIRHVWDASAPDSFGDDVMLTAVASIAEVDATPGTWYNDQVGDMIYIRTLDSRAPDTDIRYYESGAPATNTVDGRVVYWENINFRGGWNTALIKSASAAGGTKAYFKSCDFAYGCKPGSANDVVDVDGVDDVIFQSCTAHASPDGDGWNYKALNGILPLAIEIDCEAYNLGDTTIDQGSTMHDGGSVIRIGGEYHHVKGSCIADSGGGQMWLLGTSLHDSESTSTNKDGYTITDATTAWLDSLTIDVDHYDLVGSATGTIYYRNLVSGGSNDPGGTYTPY